MTELTWTKGTIAPPQSGEYYVTLEAKQDIINPVTGTVDYKTGDVMIYTDCYYAGTRFWEKLGKDNPLWTVLCWADILKPDIPDGVRDRLVEYLGTKVKWKNGLWCQDYLESGGGQE